MYMYMYTYTIIYMYSCIIIVPRTGKRVARGTTICRKAQASLLVHPGLGVRWGRWPMRRILWRDAFRHDCNMVVFIKLVAYDYQYTYIYIYIYMHTYIHIHTNNSNKQIITLIITIVNLSNNNHHHDSCNRIS